MSEMDVDQDDLYPEDDKENYNGVICLSQENVAEKEKYMRLLEGIEELRDSDDVGPHTIQRIHTILQEVKASEACLRVDDSLSAIDENILDANILNVVCEVLIKCISALQTAASNYDPVAFTTKLVEIIKDPNEEELQNKDLLKLIKDARKIVVKAPRYGFLYGAFDPTTLPEPKQRKERKTRTQEVKEKQQKKTPESLTNAKKDEQSVDEIVSHQRKVLEEEYANNEYQPINYYRFIIDTDSFSSTVENMFYFSFLIRNGAVALYIDENNQPVIKPVTKKRREKYQKEGGANIQMIASMCEDEWKTFQIGMGFLQQRRLQYLENST